MKIDLIATVKTIVADRLVAALIVVGLLLAVAYCIYIGIALRPSDLQVAVHYSAFGSTHLYRAKWYYMLTFVVFALIVAVVHAVLVAKLYLQERRPLAIVFALLTILLFVIAWYITRPILAIAFL